MVSCCVVVRSVSVPLVLAWCSMQCVVHRHPLPCLHLRLLLEGGRLPTRLLVAHVAKWDAHALCEMFGEEFA